MSNLNLTIDEEMFLSRLGYGIENARTAKEIGLNPRTIRNYVRNLRLKGVCICSGDAGYWFPADIYEVERTVARLQSTANNINKAAEAMKVAYGG